MVPSTACKNRPARYVDRTVRSGLSTIVSRLILGRRQRLAVQDGKILPLDFRRLARPVKNRRFFDIVGFRPTRRVFGGAPQGFGRGVESINGFVRLTARVVRVSRNLSGTGTSHSIYYARPAWCPVFLRH
jgi:hypothetical protein